MNMFMISVTIGHKTKIYLTYLIVLITLKQRQRLQSWNLFDHDLKNLSMLTTLNYLYKTDHVNQTSQ